MVRGPDLLPVAGAGVSLVQDPATVEQAAVTDVWGRFTFNNVPATLGPTITPTYHLSAAATGFTDISSSTFSVTDGSTTTGADAVLLPA